MANEFKVKNGLIVDAGGIQATGSIVGQNGITGSIAATNNVISGSSQIGLLGYAITGSNIFTGSQTITGSLLITGSILQNGGALAVQDGTILYHTEKWFTPSSTVSTSGTTVTSVGTQFTSAMVSAKLTISGEGRIITVFTSNTQVTVDSAYSQNYSAITASNWGVFSRAIHIDSSGNRSHYSTLGVLQQSGNYFATNIGAVRYNSNANVSTFGDFGFYTNASGAVTWGSGTAANTSDTARDLGLRRNTSGSLEIYDGATADGTLTNRRDLLVRNITGSNAFFSGSVNVTGSLTASLQKGYTWVGDGNNISVLVATSSFAGGSTDLSQLNTFTASAAIRLTNLETTSASLNISVSNLNTYSASVSNSIQQLNTFTASNANASLNTYTGSISDPKFISIGASTSSLNLFTSSAALRLTNLETTSASVNISITNLNSYSASVSNSILYVNTVTASLNTFTASAAIRLTNLETTSASVNISITNINTFTASNAIVSLNTYTGSISDPKFVQIGASTSSLNAFTSSAALRLTNLESTSASVNGHIADINSKTGSYARTNSTNTFNGTQIISGALYITQDLVVLGSSSIQNISSSNLVIGTSYVTLNTFSPLSRYAGFNFIDSGSAGLSGSLYYDSVDDEIVFVHRGNGTNITSSHIVMGPETYDNLGNETYMVVNRIPKVTNYEHIGNSNISDTGTEISLNSLTSVTGSFVATAGITGSIRATNGVVSGSTQISLAGTSDYTSLFGGIAASTSSLNTLTASLATTYEGRASATKTIFSGSSQISIAATSDYTSLFGGIASATASLNAFSASENAKANTLATLTGSIETKFAAFGASTSSLNAFTASIDSRFSALQASTASLNVYTQSNDTLNTTQNNRLTALEVATGSAYYVSQSVFFINNYTGSDAVSQSVTNARLLSLGIASSSLEFFTASQNTKNSTLATYTGSNDTKWANLAVYTASVDTKFLAVQSTTNSLNLYTASIRTALTASGVNLTANGALVVTLDVTASAFKGAGTGLTGTASGLSIGGNAATATTSTDSTKLPLAGGTLTGALLMGSSVAAASNNQPTALSFGLLQGYGNFNIAADTDASTTEYAVITAGYSVANSTAANGLSVGYNTLAWKSTQLNISSSGQLSTNFTGTPYFVTHRPTTSVTFNIGHSTGNGSTSGPFINATVNGISDTNSVPLFFNCSVFSVFIGYSESLRLTSGGTLYIGGTISQNYSSWSDRKIKQNLKVIDNPLDKISKLTGYTFEWTKDSPYRNTPEIVNRIQDAGLIAQDVEEVLPEIVRTTKESLKTVNYDGIIALHTEGIKELIKQNQELLERIKQLEQKLL
jgi:uncharacterized coiled-coil protein SlyX